ncbi:MAG: glycosyltransferase family 4 protein [Pseudomonadota bacterium]
MSKRLLVLNVFYAPQSFGGATVVAEAINESLARDLGWQVTVITTHVDPGIPPYSLRRYRAKSAEVISINLPTEKRYRDEYQNSYIDTIIEGLLPRLAPDVVHAHSIQRLGCGYFAAIKALQIPLVVTVHDAWWLCDRQFMVDLNGRYCFQEEISPKRCLYCVDRPDEYEDKAQFTQAALAMADLVLAPSAFQAQLYTANGVANCRVNGNGIAPPSAPASPARSNDNRLRFGFIGGPGPLKGAPVIIEALNQMPEYQDYVLKVVDAAQNVGVSWKDPGFWQVPGKVEFTPAYDQSGIDDFYAGIDVLLFPSQWKESFGLTVREALARDVWVIACREGGVGEAVSDGENGELIPMTSNPEPLRAAMARCLADPARMRAHRNPHRQAIRLFPDQARELDEWLRELATS